jgi:predicted amidohydrolase YtcJ
MEEADVEPVEHACGEVVGRGVLTAIEYYAGSPGRSSCTVRTEHHTTVLPGPLRDVARLGLGADASRARPQAVSAAPHAATPSAGELRAAGATAAGGGEGGAKRR